MACSRPSVEMRHAAPTPCQFNDRRTHAPRPTPHRTHDHRPPSTRHGAVTRSLHTERFGSPPCAPLPEAASPLPELDELERLTELGAPHVDTRPLCSMVVRGHLLQVNALCLGNPAPHVPAVVLVGGVHGLERIGAQVVLAYLAQVVQRLKWDEALHAVLQRVRMVFVPVLNPGGLLLGTRANPQGVDLMRNAPVEAREAPPFLVGGQRLSANLPWYRGPADQPMQPESQALCDLMLQEVLHRPLTIAIDCHSGFGIQDRLWFPYAHTRQPMPQLWALHALHRIFQQTHAHHPYIFEPQSTQYLTHGDLWDHLCLQAQAHHPGRWLLPLTLEMGSWLWVKKNPRQLFSRHGIFNPLMAHRQQRVLRRHLGLLDFMTRAAASHARWLPAEEDRALHQRQAVARWYTEAPRPTPHGGP